MKIKIKYKINFFKLKINYKKLKINKINSFNKKILRKIK